MFDSLKDKLSSFRDDVDESVEEKAEEVEESEVSEKAEPKAEPEEEEETQVGTVEESESREAETESQEEEDEESASLTQKAKTLVTERSFIIEEEDLEDPLWELERALLSSDVEVGVADTITQDVEESLVGEKRKWRESTDEIVTEALHDALVDVLDVDGLEFDRYVEEADKPVVVIFTGVNGVGKTTTIAKIARRLEDRGISSVLANGDTYRAGANEQIEQHSENLGKKLIKHDKGGDPAAVIYDAVEYAEANSIDVVLGDTAGRLHTSQDLMDQLGKIDRVVDPDLTVFVDEAVAGQDAVNRAREFNDAAEIDGTVLTKADADSQGGAAISISKVTGKPILFLGTGQGYDDLEKFDPERLADALLGSS
ncbi:MAG: signal recognition particle-docking protein FtsY [Halobacteria archaeon]|nr:signal recognition particle-docking protein FtsY [Halobacteria archaeon]